MTAIQKFFRIAVHCLSFIYTEKTTVFASNLEEQAAPAMIHLTSPFSAADRNGDGLSISFRLVEDENFEFLDE